MSVIARLAVTLDRAEFGGNARVEDADPLVPEERQQPFSFLVGHDKLHLDRHVGCQLEKMLLVQDAVAAESRERSEWRRPEPGARAESLTQRLRATEQEGPSPRAHAATSSIVTWATRGRGLMRWPPMHRPRASPRYLRSSSPAIPERDRRS